MPNTVQIDIQRTGFPVKIGSLELWFDSSLENLRRFINVEDFVEERIKEAREKAKHIHFPEEITFETLEAETVEAVFDIQKETIAAQYDVIFGDDTFKKIYKKYPDILALEQAFDVVSFAIADRIELMEIERSGKIETKKAEYLNKKAQKK